MRRGGSRDWLLLGPPGRVGPEGGLGQCQGKSSAPEASYPCDFPMADLILGPLHVGSWSLFKHRYLASF